MCKQIRVFVGAAVIGVALGFAVPLAAQQPAAAPADVPTVKDPIRFTAFNVSMNTGVAGVTVITIERWTTDEERKGLLGLVNTATTGERGQKNLLTALQKIKPRIGFIRTPNSIGWDLKYAYESKLADGTRQIVVVTDKPVTWGAAAGGSQAMDYPFTLIEMQMKDNDKGEGKMLSAASISVKNGRLEIENYGVEAVRLTTITQEQKKMK